MKPLELKIKKVFLKQIISGEKKEEFRALSPFNVSRLFVTEDIERGEKLITAAKDIKEIKFVAGYSKNPDYAVVKVEKIMVVKHFLDIWV